MDTIAQKPKSPSWLLPVTLVAAIGVQFFVPLYLVLPALIAASLMYDNRPVMAALLTAAVYGSALLLTGSTERAVLIPTLCLASVGCLGGAAIFFLQKRKNGGFHTAAVTSAVIIAALYLGTCLDGILSGAGAFTATKTYAEAIAQQMITMIESSGLPEAEAILETYRPILADFGDMVVVMTVPSLCIVGSVLGLCNTLMFRLFIRRDRAAFGLAKLRPLRDWSIPHDYSIGITVLLVGSMILMFMESEFSDAVSTTVITLVSIPLTVQAFALIDWFIVRKGKRIVFKRTLMTVLIIGMFSFISNILVTVGIFEQIFHARAHLAAMGMGPKPPQPKQEDKK